MTESLGVTPSQTVGPFFHAALPYDAGPRLVAEDDPAAVRLTGRVLDGDGQPVPDALVEIWQAGADGAFADRPGVYAEPGGFRGFGRCATDAAGAYDFVTHRPAAVPTADGVPQAPHIAMAVFARGMLRQVVTRVYFADEATTNETDPLLREAGARATTLLAHATEDGYRFDVHLQGEQETVFLDIFAR